MRKPVHPGLQRGRRHVRPDSPQLAGFRLFVCAFGLSLAVFSALNPPENLFLSLSTPHSTLSRLFPFLRHPLDIRLATETLARAWSHTLLHHRPLDEPELALLNRLQSLDARLVYIAYGAKPLMQCEWCRPPGGGNMSSLGGTIIGLDYLLASAPTILIAYLTTLAACGFLLSGNGRQRWRIWIVIPIVGGLGAEAYMRLTWDGGRGQAASGASISMIHSQLHVLRSLFFASLLTISYLAPASFHPIPALLQPDTSTIVAPALAAITNQGEDALQRLRALSIARMAVLHEDRSRKEVTDFWTSASTESRLARSDPVIVSALETRLRRRTSSGPGPSETFAAWVEEATALPAANAAAGTRHRQGPGPGPKREGATARRRRRSSTGGGEDDQDVKKQQQQRTGNTPDGAGMRAEASPAAAAPPTAD
ncbi:hypothetical protein C6P46_002736 [Rhodotorula mucilaginosa]|uniref:Uncharacterized protein n=1 Tax=Rhodotorula mucilaginosa TaxID=5537 RepID=A0A9P6W6E2_RHOMI|nr:hypothetical protein C6P46_002736 [Rhodotorula mucilaginosa]TKA52478.1 hypothetical protein B0A53_04852 [Rhodotorula sp. CCFEE 5036]